jgi:hypothetical protein
MSCTNRSTVSLGIVAAVIGLVLVVTDGVGFGPAYELVCVTKRAIKHDCSLTGEMSP